MKRKLSGSIVVACAAALVASPVVSAVGDGAEIGKHAPAFDLKDQNGKAHKLADFAGKTLVIEWFNPDCPYVIGTYEKGLAASTIAALKKDGAVFIAINSTGTAPLEEVTKKTTEFLAKHKVDHPILFDHDGAIGKKYGAKTTPHIFVIDGKGVLRYDGALSSDSKFEAKDARNFALEACQAIKAGSEPKTTFEKPWGCEVKYKASN